MKSHFNKFTAYSLLFIINIGCISNNKLEMRNEIPININTTKYINKKYQENNQRKCDYCDKPNNLLRCSRCKSTYYCDKKCQRQHWKDHKKQCKNKKDFINNTRIIPYFSNKNQTAAIIGKWFKDNVIPLRNKIDSANNQSDDNSQLSISNDINLNSDRCNQILPCDINNLISSFYSWHCNECLINIDDNFCYNNCTPTSLNNSLKFIGQEKDKCIATLKKGHMSGIWNLINLGSGKIASVSRDQTIKIWDINKKEKNKCIATLEGHTKKIFILINLGNGKIASGSLDKTIKIWDINKKEEDKCIATLEGHTNFINSLVNLGEKIASASQDKSIKIWDIINS